VNIEISTIIASQQKRRVVRRESLSPYRSKRFFIIATCLVLIGCQKSEENVSSSALVGKWQLVRYVENTGGAEVYSASPSEGEEYWVELAVDSGLRAVDACNTCPGEYELGEDNRIYFSEVNCTEMGCSGRQFLVNLNSGPYGWSIVDDTLTLSQMNGDDEGWIFILERI